MDDYKNENNNQQNPPTDSTSFHNKETSEYEPNFVMRDTPPENSADANAQETISAQEIREARARARQEAMERAAQTARAEEARRQAAQQESARRAAEAQSRADAQRAAYTQAYNNSQQGSYNQDQSYTQNQGYAQNPSYAQTDPQDTVQSQSSYGGHVAGQYEDPRKKFMSGDSSSWSNGEVKIKKGRKHRKRKPSKPVTMTRRMLGLLVAGCLVLSCLCGFGGVAAGNALLGNNTATTQQATGSAKTTGYTLENATGSEMTVKEITSKVKASVVEIKTESVSSDSWMQQYVTEGAGSGVIISEDGYIMTNNHVIEGANTITVTTSDEKEYEATLVGTDTTDDVAVIKIKASGLTPVTYGNSDQLEVGDMAVAIGNPLGELGGTVTAGIISAKDRELTIDGKTMKLLQTDSSINPGNSGGGLFNGSGQLIGLVVAKSSGSDVEGLGFAIPINTAADKAQQIIDKGYVSGQPWTGMSYTESSGSSMDGFSSFFGESEGTSSGSVYIASVDTTTAKAAGFQVGDMVFAVDGTQISSVDDLSAIVTKHEVGDKLTYTIVRNGQTQELKIKLQEKKGSTSTDNSSSSSSSDTSIQTN